MANMGEANCKEITTSSLHANLDRDKMFKSAWWLQYCCCRGTAIGAVGEPFAAAEARNLCIHETCQLTSVGDPFCSNIGVECCITSQCAFPKIEGSPVCVCCNKTLAGDGSNWKPKLFSHQFGFDQQFWLYYFLCAGVSVHKPQANDRPILGFQVKQLCIKEEGKCTAPIQDGVLCSGVGTFACCWNQMQFPPAEKAPKIACCGWKLNKGDTADGEKVAPFSYGKPTQVEMK
jgi:hypothetical protein